MKIKIKKLGENRYKTKEKQINNNIEPGKKVGFALAKPTFLRKTM
jgi:hypothetical protein